MCLEDTEDTGSMFLRKDGYIPQDHMENSSRKTKYRCLLYDTHTYFFLLFPFLSLVLCTKCSKLLAYMYTEQPYLQKYRVSQQNCSASSVRILYQEFAIHFTEIIFCPRRSTTTRTSREIQIELNELLHLNMSK